MTARKKEREEEWRTALRLPAVSNGGRPYLDVLVEAAIEQANKELGPVLDEVVELREKARVVREGDHPPYAREDFERLLAVSEQRGHVRWKDYVYRAVMDHVTRDEEANTIIDDADQAEVSDELTITQEAVPDDLRDAVISLHNMLTLGAGLSPTGLFVKNRYPGLAHTIDRVTRLVVNGGTF